MDRSTLINICLGIISGVLTTTLLTGSKYAYNNYIGRQRHSFIYKSLKDYPVIQIILPSIRIETFGFDHNNGHMSHNSPPNVLFMPFNESFAVHEITSSIGKIFTDKEVKFIYASQYDESMPVISVGGPSVNEFTNKILTKNFPTFQINYPEATEAKFQGLTFTSEQDKITKTVSKDYGFLFLTFGNNKAPCYVACGILAFGTQVAVKKMLSLKATSGIGKLLITRKAKFMSVEADVEGFNANVGNATIVI